LRGKFVISKNMGQFATFGNLLGQFENFGKFEDQNTKFEKL